MNIVLIGINHKTAPIEIREQFYLTSIQQDLLLTEIKCEPVILEAFVISTCNRTEICINVLDDRTPFEDTVKLILSVKKIPFSKDMLDYFYCLKNEDAVKHILHVASGLDSLVIGEKQILGQIKNSFERSVEKKLFYKEFNILSNIVIRAGKKARTETDISVGGSSVSWAAIKAAEKLLGSLKEKSVLIIGAGKMSDLAVGHIQKKGFSHLYLMNRTYENAQKLAEKCGGDTVPFCDIKEVFPKIDVCICAADAPHYILDLETIEKINEHSPITKKVLIDISMPRNIDPKIGDFKNIDLLAIDDLNQFIAKNLHKRMQAINDVEQIIEQKLKEFYIKISKTSNIDTPINTETISH